MDIFDIVNERDEVIGKAPRSEVHRSGAFHRSVHILMFCGTGTDRKILVQMRSALKDRYPLRLTAPCSGHVDSGETYETAVIRETKEETGLVVALSNLKFLEKFNPCAETENEFAEVWTLELSGDETFSFDPSEVEWVKWMKMSEFSKLISENPDTLTPAFLKIFRFYLSNGGK